MSNWTCESCGKQFADAHADLMVAAGHRELLYARGYYWHRPCCPTMRCPEDHPETPGAEVPAEFPSPGRLIPATLGRWSEAEVRAKIAEPPKEKP